MAMVTWRETMVMDSGLVGDLCLYIYELKTY